MQRQLARYFLHGLRHYATQALVALLQPLGAAVAATQSAPASDAHETKQRQALQHTLRQIYDKAAARPGSAEHLTPIAEWGRRHEEGGAREHAKQEAPKDEKREAAAEAGKADAAQPAPQQSAEAHAAAQASPTK